ncbi:glycoside hydrolase family 2 protein [Deinococcus peraridilitoris]|uniref:Beta-galactosidase/beta-glucuronidase n=1 Tax=Deinococcus peraridilitoris (strain DSM 19664 / LMG 22246 / CIP 109416 / KR-200) TaxID=937777 RepID=L0A6M7_DEIPD|nr:sugar-binding domain-containing protein [Deinococcus peraridilitoris]AFZ68842.1 beta-galactosidase/beta-glucuronidase [Deinococcus peraridilitoris DSM 19664]
MTDVYERHPRPQLARSRWVDLCGTWNFAFDDADQGLTERWFERGVSDAQIVVPFPPESSASEIHDAGYHAILWYARTFQIADTERSGRLLLHFGAVDYRARVWLNGQLVAEHEGGHTPFTADVTDALASGTEQLLVVRSQDDPTDLSQPRGKQDWQQQPHAIWYHRTSGIWQPVWLEWVGGLYIQEVRWTPDADRTELRLQVRLNRPPTPGTHLRVRLTLRGELLALQDVHALSRSFTCTLPLQFLSINPERDDLLWSPRHPNLIEAHLTLQDGERPLDEVFSYAGLRSAQVKGGRFLLNGLSYYLRLVLAQNYWPSSHLAAPSAQALRREVELAKEMGFNGVRIHQKIEDPRFLYWCDRLGLLVWEEMPSAYAFTPEMCERLTREWLEVLRRDYSHPCIVTWVPMNESWGVPNLEGDPAQRAFVRGLYQLTRALDPTRPAMGNDGWQFVGGDLIGVHDYAPHGETLRERFGTLGALEHTLRQVQPYFRNILSDDQARSQEAVVLSEFGGLSFAPGEGERWFGYSTVQSNKELLDRYQELVEAVLHSDVLAGFCYTQLTDTEQETNGLLSAEREPKLPLASLRAINSGFARSLPGDVLGNIHQEAQARHESGQE